MTSRQTSVQFDFTGILQALPALASEVALDTLSVKVLKIAMEIVEAEKGYLLIENGGNWDLQAIAQRDATNRAIVRQSVSEGETKDLPTEIINYVGRTLGDVIVGDAVEEGAFTCDSYIVRHQPKSILCLPLVGRDRLQGLLYLENQRAAGVFGDDLLSAVKLLCSQAAISIDNARRYHQLEDYSRTLEVKLETRTRELQAEIRESKLLEEKLHTSESKMRAVLEAMTDIVLVIDDRGSIEVVPTNTALLYDPSTDIIGQTIEQFFQEDRWESWWRQVELAKEMQQTISFDYSLQIGDRQLWFAALISPMPNDAVIWVARDISDRYYAELELRFSEERFSKAFRASPIAIAITSRSDGRHIEVNDTFCDFIGYTPEEILGNTAVDLNLWVHQSDRAFLFKLLSESGIVRNYEFDFRTKSGAVRTALLSAEVINIHGQECLLALSNDITERKQALEALRQKNEELANALQQLKLTQQELVQSEKMAALGQLIAGIAHEINTPLGAIQASISNISNALDNSLQQLPQLFQQLSPKGLGDFFALLETALQNSESISFREERKLKRTLKQELEVLGIQGADSISATLVKMGVIKDIERFIPLFQEKNNDLIVEAAYNLSLQKNNSKNIMLAVARASKMIFALKSYARSDRAIQKEKAQITEGIDVVLTIYNTQLRQGINVRKSYEKVPEITCYFEELNQVWTNLIHNAIQAMNGKGDLEIIVCQQQNNIVVQLTDSGCGISPDIQERIFEPFFTTKPAGEGSGLGLDIVKKIIDKHQGKIELESEPGRTTFKIYLPIS